MITKCGSVLDLRSFSFQSRRSDNFDHVDSVIAKGVERTEVAFCTVSGQMFGNKTILTTSVPQKFIALSAVSINIGQKAFENILKGYNNDSLTSKIYDRTRTNESSQVSCCEKVKRGPLSSMVDDTDKGSKSL